MEITWGSGMKNMIYSSPVADFIKMESESIMFMSVDNDAFWDELWTNN